MTLTGHSDAPDGFGAAQVAAVLDWWRDAGVDLAFADEARAWLNQPAASATAQPVEQRHAPPPVPEPERPRIGGDAGHWPTKLGDFAQWWLTEPSLDGGSVIDRIAPHGPLAAPLMVLVDHPEEGDSQHLLAGPQGALLDGFLAAAGLGRDEIYLAACLPRHTPMADWASLHANGLADVIAHHIKLAAPQRLIVFGSHISPLAGHDPAKSANSLRRFNHESADVPGLVAPGMASLLGRPRGKARLWFDWLEWTGNDRT